LVGFSKPDSTVRRGENKFFKERKKSGNKINLGPKTMGSAFRPRKREAD
jgi:hypothetical protein